jgi:hypothetical protein
VQPRQLEAQSNSSPHVVQLLAVGVPVQDEVPAPGVQPTQWQP